MIPATGIGNYMEEYWVDRAIAFWWDMTFGINESCQCNDHKKLYKFCDGFNLPKWAKQKIWTQFLPRSSHFTFHSLLPLNTSNAYNISIDRDEYLSYVEYLRIIYDVIIDGPMRVKKDFKLDHTI